MTLQLASLTAPLVAQAATGRGYTISWAVVLAAVILVMVVALRPAKRETDFRRPRD